MRRWLSIGLFLLTPALTGCFGIGGDANYFAVATGQDTHAISIANFHVAKFFGSELLVCERYDLFLGQDAQNAEIVLSGSGTGSTTGSGSTTGGRSTGGSGSTTGGVGSSTGGTGSTTGTGTGTGAIGGTTGG